MSLAHRPATGSCRICGVKVSRGAKFCDRCFDILVAHDDEAGSAPDDDP